MASGSQECTLPATRPQAQHRRHGDPLWRFPYHINADIVHLSLPDPDASPPGRYTDRLLDLTDVSQHWEHLLLSESQLWTMIVADGRLDEYLYKLALSCSLSAQRPLAVQLDVRLAPDELEDVLVALKEHRERIVTLDLVASKYVLNEDIDAILRPLKEILGSLPALKRLEFHSLGYIDNHAQSKSLAYAAIHPHLTTLNGLDITPTILQTKWAQTAQRVSSYMYFRDLIPYLQKLKYAEEVVFRKTYTYPVISPSAIPPSPLHWRKVELLENIVGVSRFLLPSLVDTLVDLTLGIETADLVDLFQNLQAAARLRRLCMILIVTESVYDITLDATFSSLPQLNTLQIRVYSFNEEVWWYPGSLMRPLRLMISALPNVTQFELSGTRTSRLLPLCSAIDGLPNLEAAVLFSATEKLTLGPKQFQLAPSITRLEVHDESDTFSQFRSEEVKDLVLRKNPLLSNDRPQFAELKWWPNVRTLQLSNSFTIVPPGASTLVPPSKSDCL